MIKFDEEKQEWVSVPGAWTYDDIQGFTGFASGEPFKSEEEVWEYFLGFNEHFPDVYDVPLPQWALFQMAEEVIRNRWHCTFPPSEED